MVSLSFSLSYSFINLTDKFIIIILTILIIKEI